MTSNVNTPKVPYANLNQDLIDGCKKGDQKAQFQIYKMYYKAMYNTSLRLLNNPMEAEDIMQESFLSAFEKIETYPGTVSFGAWLKKIVINQSIDFIRKERNVIFEDIDSFWKEDHYPIDDSTKVNETEIKVDEVKDAIKRLPDGCRIIITLYLLEGYNHQEIGELLSISPVTAGSQFSQAKHMLVRELSGNLANLHW
jgi:RNA polymerase sigma-70 factor (ECF subfamily)